MGMVTIMLADIRVSMDRVSMDMVAGLTLPTILATYHRFRLASAIDRQFTIEVAGQVSAIRATTFQLIPYPFIPSQPTRIPLVMRLR